jgi:hypothetical protein
MDGINALEHMKAIRYESKGSDSITWGRIREPGK